MPQQDQPIRIAQAVHPHTEGTTAESTHAAEGRKELEYKLGDIPDAGLLASNAIIVALLLVGMAVLTALLGGLWWAWITLGAPAQADALPAAVVTPD